MTRKWKIYLISTNSLQSSRWVRNSTYQHLGPFIATLDANSVPEQLLAHYTGMIDGTRSQYGDSDTVRFCAFSFPGVLLTLGKDKWESLQTVYFTLTQDLQVNSQVNSFFILYYTHPIFPPNLLLVESTANSFTFSSRSSQNIGY